MPQNMCSPCKSLFKLSKEACQVLKGKPKRSKLFTEGGMEDGWREEGQGREIERWRERVRESESDGHIVENIESAPHNQS